MSGGEQHGADDPVDVAAVERALLGRYTLTRGEVADRAGVPMDVAEELWQQLGFPHAADDDVAFGRRDLKALQRTVELADAGVLTPESRAALVRTWGRAFARLAEWQVSLLAEVAAADEDPERRLGELMAVVLPNVEKLQTYAWRRHLASAAGRLLASGDEDGSSTMAVGFIDIVGYTSRSRDLTEVELVEWVDHFERTSTAVAVEAGGRVIKTIGDEVLYVADDAHAAAEIALDLVDRGEDDDDPYPRVRAGLAHGPVVSRLGDVFGPTVNVASRLTTVARPGTVLVDRGARDALDGDAPAGDAGADTASPYRFRRLLRRSVKGYSRLEPFVLRRG